ncbi:MAG: hypothetical protein FJX31_01125 [Alphaproteobacteria bacterium]|nr:hypothetical protein [Alphaproteobacteria bacterium]
MNKPVRIVICLVALAAAGAAWAQATEFALLDRLERGNWSLTYRIDDAGPGRICVATGRELIQLRHSRLKCRSVILEDTRHAVTVQYSCPGNGYGRTHIRRESDRLVQIDTQGIESGLPFAFAAEARWIGACQR